MSRCAREALPTRKPRRVMSPAMANEARRLASEGVWAQEISRRLGIHHKTVAKWAARENVALARGVAHNGATDRAITGERAEQIRRLAPTMTATAAARAAGVAESTLRSWARRRSVVFVRKEPSEAQRATAAQNLRAARAARWADHARTKVAKVPKPRLTSGVVLTLLGPSERDDYLLGIRKGFTMAEALRIAGRADLIPEARR